MSAKLRDRIAALVEAHPGLHLRALERVAPTSFGSLRHHLARLERDGAVVSQVEGGRKRYFPGLSDPAFRRAAAVLRHATMRRVVLLLLARPGLRGAAIAHELGLAPSTVSGHLKRLRQLGLLRSSAGGGAEVERPEQVRLALRALRPSLMDRLVDAALQVLDEAERGRP